MHQLQEHNLAAIALDGSSATECKLSWTRCRVITAAGDGFWEQETDTAGTFDCGCTYDLIY